MQHDPALKSQIIRLARSGSLDQAWALFETSGLAAAEDDVSALTLKARLVKDRARRAAGSEAARLFAEASALYERAATAGLASYPLINAATLSLLAGKRDRSVQLAWRVLEVLDADPQEAETRYWLGATRAEALLLLGKLPEARAALRTAVNDAPRAWEDRAATIGQFALICDELGCDATWLDRFRPPRSVQYSGIMRLPQSDPPVQARLAKWLEAENAGFGFGALAAGADIWIAEALVARGAGLNVILPCPVATFREMSVAAVDPVWVPRFDRLLGLADTVDELDAAPVPSPAAVGLTDGVSLGLAIHNARILQSEPLRLRLAGEQDGGAGKEHGATRLLSLPASPLPGAVDFDVSEAGVARVMLRVYGADLLFFDGPSEAWAAARALASEGTGVALDYRFVSDASGADDPIRLDAIAGVAEAGQVLASKALAFALLAEAPSVHIETIGEVRAASGFFPVYALC